MWNEVLAMQKKRGFVLSFLAFTVVYGVLYTVLDTLNGGYADMAAEYGVWLVALNIAMNVVMSVASAAMMNWSSAYVKLSGKEGKGTFLSSAAVLFGMLTYGCTSCVIAFFAAIGITFSVMILPLAGLPYKALAFLLLIVGAVWLIAEIKRARCRIPKAAPSETKSNP
jgi:magnesium-transporting ATPase (P-type)